MKKLLALLLTLSLIMPTSAANISSTRGDGGGDISGIRELWAKIAGTTKIYLNNYDTWCTDSGGATCAAVTDIISIAGGAIPSAGSDTEVQFNSSGVLGADSDFTYTTATDTLGVDQIQLDITNTTAPSEGQINWNSDIGTAQVGMPGGTVVGQMFEEMFLPNRPKNNEAVQINNGEIVYISGATGAVPEVELANAGLPNALKTIAIATESIAASQRGYYVTFGSARGDAIDNLDTTYVTSEGDDAYLDTTDGQATGTMPTFPNFVVRIGKVLRKHATEGVLFVDPKVERGDDIANFFNGTIRESFDATVSSDGVTITMSLERSGTGDLNLQFSDGLTTLDTTPAATIALTAGTDSAPQSNYIYIPKSTKVLTKSTTGFPTSGEHIKVGYFFVQSATGVQSDGGTYINQNWNDHLAGTETIGHLAHIGDKLRRGMDIYSKGLGGGGDAGTYIKRTIGTPDIVNIAVASGEGYQVHRQTIPAKDTSGSDDFHVVNESTGAYTEGTDLHNFILDADGDSMAGKYYNLVLWTTVNKTGEYSPLMINLPTCSYSLQADAESDSNKCNVYDIPREFIRESSTGMLIARLTMKDSVPNSLELISTVNLRGITPTEATGGANMTHDPVTLAGTPDYLTISGQEITMGAIDISDDTNLAVSGTLLDLTGDTLSINEGTLTDTYVCTYASGSGLVCNTDPSSIGGSGTAYYDCLVGSAGDYATIGAAVTGGCAKMKLAAETITETGDINLANKIVHGSGAGATTLVMGAYQITDATNLDFGYMKVQTAQTVANDSLFPTSNGQYVHDTYFDGNTTAVTSYLWNFAGGADKNFRIERNYFDFPNNSGGDRVYLDTSTLNSAGTFSDNFLYGGGTSCEDKVRLNGVTADNISINGFWKTATSAGESMMNASYSTINGIHAYTTGNFGLWFTSNNVVSDIMIRGSGSNNIDIYTTSVNNKFSNILIENVTDAFCDFNIAGGSNFIDNVQTEGSITVNASDTYVGSNVFATSGITGCGADDVCLAPAVGTANQVWTSDGTYGSWQTAAGGASYGDVLTRDANEVGLTIDVDGNTDAQPILSIIADGSQTAQIGAKINLGSTGTGYGQQILGSTPNHNTQFQYVAEFPNGTLAARATEIQQVAALRTNTATTGTIADNYDVAYFQRSSTQNGAGGTLTESGSVVKMENKVTQTAGTLTDTVSVLAIIQDTDSTGNQILAKYGATEVFVVNKDGVINPESSDPCGTNAAGYVFINTVSTKQCICNASSVDVETTDNTTACF